MTPAGLFSLALFLTAGAAISEAVLRKMHRKRLLKIAAEWRMNYSPWDQFRLTPRVAGSFPVPGAAKIRVVDLIYGIEAGTYRYIFTTEYTAGLVTGKRRVLRAASLSESRERTPDAPLSPITLAPAHLPLVEQYRSLMPAAAG